MGHDEPVGVEDPRPPEQHVEVDRARPVADLTRPIAPEQALDLDDDREQLARPRRRRVRGDRDRGVQEVRLPGGPADRRGAHDRRAAHAPPRRQRRPRPREPVEHRGGTAAVAAEADYDHAVGQVPHVRAITGLRSTPMSAISTSTMSPTARLPTPAGVPVVITSPGSSVMCADTNSLRVGTSKIRSAVDESWRTAPLTRVVIRRLDGSSPATIRGPSGQNPSKPLARVNWTSFFCRSRTVTSLTQQNPMT